MANELTQKNGKEMTKEQIELIKRTVAKGAGDDEFAMFIYLAKQHELDPFLKEICFIKRRVWNPYKQGYDEVPSIMTTRDGFLAIAHRTGQFGGIESDVIYDEKGILDGAWCKVWNKSFQQPVSVKIKFKEYCAYGKEGKPQALWSSKPETMAKKVAESQALRKAFNIKGIYGEEEMQAEIQKDSKTELEYMKDTIDVSEKIHSTKENYDEWAQDIKTKILDDIATCETAQQLSHVKKQYETDMGRLMDEDRNFIQSEFDNKFQRIVSDEQEPEIQPSGEVIDRKTGQEVELGEKTPQNANGGEIQGQEKPFEPENETLAQKEAFGQTFLKQAMAELAFCHTRAQLTVFRNRHVQSRLKLLKEQREYFDIMVAQAFAKTK